MRKENASSSSASPAHHPKQSFTIQNLRALSAFRRTSAVEHRRVASEAVGYTRQSQDQILALVRAARDPDDVVRNNATRALASTIPPDTFIDMLNSGTWTDRNKGTALLVQLTATRNSELLANIRLVALYSLIEMASWRRPGHAYFARMVLGRVAGLEEDRLSKLAINGPVDAILAAAGLR
jgi:HEAT repeat protein